MLEVSRPSNVLNIDADFQKQVPVVEGKYWSDFLMMAPGVISRPHNDGSGRQNYFGNAVEHRDAVTLMEGLYAGNYNDFNINRTGLSSEAIEDTEIKTGGVDAASPMGYGLVINMVSKSGGNQFRGNVSTQYQPFEWNANNVGEGTPATRQVYQYRLLAGRPDQARQHVVLRRAPLHGQQERHRSHAGAGCRPPGADSRRRAGQQLDSRVPAVGQNHYQGCAQAMICPASTRRDRLLLKVVGAEDYEPVEVLSTGGPMYGAKLTSVWGTSVTSIFSTSYNSKGGNSLDSYAGRNLTGPLVEYHREAFANQGILQGSGLLVRGGQWASTACDACYDLDTSSILMFRGDLTWYARGWGGSHDVQTGFLALPRNQFDKNVRYLNDGFIFEERRQINPADPAAGTLPFHRQFVVGSLDQHTASGRDRDIGLYAQDTWKPGARFTATLGLRVDFVRRYDALRDLVRQESTEVAPRLGFSYLLTEDAKNVLRGSYVRIHQQLMGTRHPVAAFGGDDAAGLRDTYDANGDGVFETVIVTPPRASAVSSQQFDPELHQPLFDEFTARLQAAVPGADERRCRRHRQDQQAAVRAGRHQRHLSRRSEPAVRRLRTGRSECGSPVSRDEQHLEPDGLPGAADYDREEPDAGHSSFSATIHRQWQHLTGTWNPTDPARFIQPDAFPNNRLVWRTDGMQDHNSLATGNTLTNNPMWNPVLGPAGRQLARAGRVSGVGQLHDHGGPVQRSDHRPDCRQQPAARAIRSRNRNVVDRRTAAEPAGDSHPLLPPDSR